MRSESCEMGEEHARWREQYTYGFEVEKNLEYLRDCKKTVSQPE